jgi:hypothetical protein
MTGWSILAQRALFARAIVRFMRYRAKTVLTPRRGKVTSYELLTLNRGKHNCTTGTVLLSTRHARPTVQCESSRKRRVPCSTSTERTVQVLYLVSGKIRLAAGRAVCSFAFHIRHTNGASLKNHRPRSCSRVNEVLTREERVGRFLLS